MINILKSDGLSNKFEYNDIGKSDRIRLLSCTLDSTASCTYITLVYSDHKDCD